MPSTAKKIPHLDPGKLDIALVRGTLKTLLCTINGFEGFDSADWKLVESSRKLLDDFMNWLERHPEFQNNSTRLAELDDAFHPTKGAGWDNQGLRWYIDPKTNTACIHVVEFTNEEHTAWKLP